MGCIVLGAIVLAGCADADTATTTTTTPGGDVDAAISLTIDVTSEGQAVREGTLSCGERAEGTGHLAGAGAAQAACDLLRSDPGAVQRLVAGRDPDLLCTQIYGGPEVAVVTGEIEGQRVDATIDRTDGCGIAEWDLLQPLLGPPGT